MTFFQIKLQADRTQQSPAVIYGTPFRSQEPNSEQIAALHQPTRTQYEQRQQTQAPAQDGYAYQQQQQPSHQYIPQQYQQQQPIQPQPAQQQYQQPQQAQPQQYQQPQQQAQPQQYQQPQQQVQPQQYQQPEQQVQPQPQQQPQQYQPPQPAQLDQPKYRQQEPQFSEPRALPNSNFGSDSSEESFIQRKEGSSEEGSTIVDMELEGLNENIVDSDLLERVQQIIEEHEKQQKEYLEKIRKAPEGENDSENSSRNQFQDSNIYSGYNENQVNSNENNANIPNSGRNDEVSQNGFDSNSLSSGGYSDPAQKSGNPMPYSRQATNSHQGEVGSDQQTQQSGGYFSQPRAEGARGKALSGNSNIEFQPAILTGHFVESMPESQVRRGKSEGQYPSAQQNGGPKSAVRLQGQMVETSAPRDEPQGYYQQQQRSQPQYQAPQSQQSTLYQTPQQSQFQGSGQQERNQYEAPQPNLYQTPQPDPQSQGQYQTPEQVQQPNYEATQQQQYQPQQQQQSQYQGQPELQSHPQYQAQQPRYPTVQIRENYSTKPYQPQTEPELNKPGYQTFFLTPDQARSSFLIPQTSSETAVSAPESNTRNSGYESNHQVPVTSQRNYESQELDQRPAGAENKGNEERQVSVQYIPSNSINPVSPRSEGNGENSFPRQQGYPEQVGGQETYLPPRQDEGRVEPTPYQTFQYTGEGNSISRNVNDNPNVITRTIVIHEQPVQGYGTPGLTNRAVITAEDLRGEGKEGVADSGPALAPFPQYQYGNPNEGNPNAPAFHQSQPQQQEQQPSQPQQQYQFLSASAQISVGGGPAQESPRGFYNAPPVPSPLYQQPQQEQGNYNGQGNEGISTPRPIYGIPLAPVLGPESLQEDPHSDAVVIHSPESAPDQPFNSIQPNEYLPPRNDGPQRLVQEGSRREAVSSAPSSSWDPNLFTIYRLPNSEQQQVGYSQTHGQAQVSPPLVSNTVGPPSYEYSSQAEDLTTSYGHNILVRRNLRKRFSPAVISPLAGFFSTNSKSS